LSLFYQPNLITGKRIDEDFVKRCLQKVLHNLVAAFTDPLHSRATIGASWMTEHPPQVIRYLLKEKSHDT
jgi:hypothetical protein